MPTLKPMTFDLPLPLTAISEKSFADHYKMYTGYVDRFNELWRKLEAVRARGSVTAIVEIESLKVDLTYALGAVKNHENYFGILGNDADGPMGSLADALKRDFGGVPGYMVDLKQSAAAARGWAWTAYDLDHGHLFNYSGNAQNAMPVPNVIPILTIDLYGHAYFYDFGNNKTAYIEAVLQDIAWEKMRARYENARGLRESLASSS
jgi:Fe-Mn family superoxide dismutase